ncbi:hypothetical protein [Curtobacterium sp. MCLR17_054]|uniref:hypothetical protein n=1 Tax=Curtobacterium sp. MCLR17_054 TaxID=2175632 RepID=UPI0011B61C60|nr:hypothetical protein [Curtobacterium sp. MCLR17_054]WIE70241.1 hypothetical protein DEJ08_018505 [Curtobacterium sp. MCLR17_054]
MAPMRGLPLPPMTVAERTGRRVTISVADADAIRAASDHRFPPKSRTAAALHRCLDVAEAARHVCLTVTDDEAETLRSIDVAALPDRIADALEDLLHLQFDGPNDDTADLVASVSVANVRALYRHYLQDSSRPGQAIRAIVECSNYLTVSMRVELCWESAFLIDTLTALHPRSRALRNARA